MPTEANAGCLGPDGSAAKVAAALALVSGRWKLPILFTLFERPTVRYLALLRAVAGVTPKMLTQQLRQLERDGLLTRVDRLETPRRVEYALSSSGRALRPTLVGLRDFYRERERNAVNPPDDEREVEDIAEPDRAPGR